MRAPSDGGFSGRAWRSPTAVVRLRRLVDGILWRHQALWRKRHVLRPVIGLIVTGFEARPCDRRGRQSRCRRRHHVQWNCHAANTRSQDGPARGHVPQHDVAFDRCANGKRAGGLVIHGDERHPCAPRHRLSRSHHSDQLEAVFGRCGRHDRRRRKTISADRLCLFASGGIGRGRKQGRLTHRGRGTGRPHADADRRRDNDCKPSFCHAKIIAPRGRRK